MKKLLVAAFGAFGLLAGVALAQTPQIPLVVSVGPQDLIPDIVGGVPGVPTHYATAAQVNGPVGYVKTTPVTAFNLSFANGQSYYLITPAGTLATGNFNLSPNPGQGQRNCVRSTQTQTAVTLTAASGQTITGGITAMTAATTYCFIFDQATSTWNAI
ncbi:MAG TPA: hypothetical protein VN702_05730 [Acetobacteraceae bacterium]|nr:hypothetical protein [Acetobacteraceae bacterium]